MQISNALNEREFWTCCNKDLERAEGHVIFESAFVSVARLRLLQNSLIRLVRRGVTVCVFLQQPWGWNCRADALPPDAVARIRELKACLRLLSDWGIHVNLRTKVHRKFVIVDRSTHYEGGLNPLSHLGNAEHMRRFDGGSETESIIGKYRLLDCGRCGELLG